MKNIQSLFRNVTRKTRPVCQQMELPLPGSRLTRDEVSFLLEIRRLREQLAKASGAFPNLALLHNSRPPGGLRSLSTSPPRRRGTGALQKFGLLHNSRLPWRVAVPRNLFAPAPRDRRPPRIPPQGVTARKRCAASTYLRAPWRGIFPPWGLRNPRWCV
jgi:hypothetical protein